MSSWHPWQVSEPTYSAGLLSLGAGAGAPALSWAPHRVAVSSVATATTIAPHAQVGREGGTTLPLGNGQCTCVPPPHFSVKRLQPSVNGGRAVRAGCAMAHAASFTELGVGVGIRVRIGSRVQVARGAGRSGGRRRIL